MNLKEAMKTIDDGWVRRLKGFRIHFQKWDKSKWVTDYFPSKEQKPITSEISTWELARRFAEATEPDSPEIGDGDFVNIYVVDDLGNPVKFYATNQPQILNHRKGAK